MINCKNFKIYKFKFAYPHGDGEKPTKERWRRGRELTTFKQILIDNFCSNNFQELCNKSIDGTIYKGYRISPFDTGVDMLQDEYGLHFGYYWDQLYIAVPISNLPLINFFEQNKPNWVTTVKKI